MTPEANTDLPRRALFEGPSGAEPEGVGLFRYWIYMSKNEPLTLARLGLVGAFVVPVVLVLALFGTFFVGSLVAYQVIGAYESAATMSEWLP